MKHNTNERTDMNIDALTLGQIKEIQSLACGAPSKSHSYVVGRSYLIRTVTLYQLGRLVSVTDTDMVLEDASWVADVGRFHAALKTGELSEVEPFPGAVIVSRGAIVDAAEWTHTLPREAK